MPMTWVCLIAGGVFESFWVVTMKKSEGFTRPGWVAATAAFVVVSVYLLALAMRGIGPGTAYAVWTGIGAVGALLFGIWLFEEAMDFARVGFIALIVAGIVGLNLLGVA